MIEITEELLQRIYNQANEVFRIKVDKYGFDYLEIQEDGSLRVVVSGSYRSDDDHYDLSIKDLNEDYDELIKERKIKEEKERVEIAIRAEKALIAYQTFSKKQREQQYLELKKNLNRETYK